MTTGVFQLIKTSVAQVLVATETQAESPGWSCLGCGAVCLFEDESLRSYFLRLYCVKRAKLLWEQELYIPFKYAATRMYFHTFPADGHQVGLNFANEIEAEEFHRAVEAVQRDQEKMTRVCKKANADKEDSSTSGSPDSGIKPLHHLDGEPHSPVDATATKVAPTTSSLTDLDPSMRRLLMQAKVTEEGLKDKDTAEAVDCIINQFGGLKVVQRELRNRGPVSQTLPRAAGASIFLALGKGPLPLVPSIKDTLCRSPIPPWIPPPPPARAPVDPERIRKSASFNHVGSSTAAERSDLILAAVREVFREKKPLQQSTRAEGGQTGVDTDMQ
ncbi:neural Wiskott-Aldrich syndrome protein [Chelmon rostratus]|uniref:neural Wiskott-Aldrich syndrome protein n=1 Tax=Chelmon rostratus TaxID=109905 RepID=UPI001BE75A03|nr:neural Wiskott-Aldrich syndrome protein [Chelmon rostratus]